MSIIREQKNYILPTLAYQGYWPSSINNKVLLNSAKIKTDSSHFIFIAVFLCLLTHCSLLLCLLSVDCVCYVFQPLRENNKQEWRVRVILFLSSSGSVNSTSTLASVRVILPLSTRRTSQHSFVMGIFSVGICLHHPQWEQERWKDACLDVGCEA